MGLSLPHLIVVALVILLLFGRGKISEMMGDFGKGIKSFKQGLNDEENKPVQPPAAQIPASSTPSPDASATPQASEKSGTGQP